MRLQCSLESMDNSKSPPRSRAERPNGFDCVGVQDRMDGIEDSQCREYPFQKRMSSEGRMSEESIRSLVAETDEDFPRLMDLVGGIKIIADETFEPNLKPPELRAKYIRMAPAVNRLMYELYELGLIMIIPTSMAMSIPGVHFSCSHWAT